MSTLMRAPQECASWAWELDEFAAPGLDSALMTAAQMTAVLRGHELLEPAGLEWDWFVFGVGGLGLHTRFSLTGKSLEDSHLAQQVLQCRPVGFPEAQVSDILVSGAGTWLDAEGKNRREHRLVELTVSPDSIGLSAEVAVFHDIWGEFDFRGQPHPNLHKRNAPRLAAALQALDSLLGVAAAPGEATYFGRAEGHGIQVPDVLDGRGPDLTDLL